MLACVCVRAPIECIHIDVLFDQMRAVTISLWPTPVILAGFYAILGGQNLELNGLWDIGHKERWLPEQDLFIVKAKIVHGYPVRDIYI